MPRKDRADAAAAQVRVMAASTTILPPASVPLTDRDMPFFASVLAEFARADWSAHQLEIAALMARTMADLEQEQRLLRQEGSVMQTDRGQALANPRRAVVQMHAGLILSFRRSLALHARGRAGDNRNAARARELAKDAEDGVEFDDDDLLARPN